MTATNPGNVKNEPFSNWQGSIGVDSRGLAIFTDMDGHMAQAWGVRAMVRTLARKAANGKRSLSEIIRDWAPADDPEAHNDPEEYAATVAKWMGVDVDRDLCIFGTRGDVIDYNKLVKIIAAIATYENGHDYKLSVSKILDGIELYLERWGPKE